MRDAFPGGAQAEVCQMVVCTRLIRGDLPAEQDGKARIVLDDRVELVSGKGKARTVERQRAEWYIGAFGTD